MSVWRRLPSPPLTPSPPPGTPPPLPAPSPASHGCLDADSIRSMLIGLEIAKPAWAGPGGGGGGGGAGPELGEHVALWMREFDREGTGRITADMFHEGGWGCVGMGGVGWVGGRLGGWNGRGGHLKCARNNTSLRARHMYLHTRAQHTHTHDTHPHATHTHCTNTRTAHGVTTRTHPLHAPLAPPPPGVQRWVAYRLRRHAPHHHHAHKHRNGKAAAHAKVAEATGQVVVQVDDGGGDDVRAPLLLLDT
jgi:hypothetical protein